MIFVVNVLWRDVFVAKCSKQLNNALEYFSFNDEFGGILEPKQLGNRA